MATGTGLWLLVDAARLLNYLGLNVSNQFYRSELLPSRCQMPSAESVAYFISFTKRTKAVIDSLSPADGVRSIDLERTVSPGERSVGKCWIDIEDGIAWFVFSSSSGPYQVRMTLESVRRISARIGDAPDIAAAHTKQPSA